MSLPEERPEDIALLLQWVYHRAVSHTSYQKVGKPGSRFNDGLHHEQIDPCIHRYQEFIEAKRLLKRTLGKEHKQVVALKRPKPPAFGPLVRLYVLADKFDIKELKSEICRRVREVGKEAKCVPEREDVQLLWDGIVEEADMGLKNTIVEMYARLRCKSFRAVFSADGENEEWCQGFMGELVVRLLGRGENLKGRKDREGEECGAKGVAREVARSVMEGVGVGSGYVGNTTN